MEGGVGAPVGISPPGPVLALACGSPDLPVEDKFHSCHSPASEGLFCFVSSCLSG